MEADWQPIETAPRDGAPADIIAVTCPFCGRTDNDWDDDSLRLGKRWIGHAHGGILQYHCLRAFYGAQ